ncbi:TetR/AcrR family transcriptional regulator [Sphingomicrobium aestuariivivum]|uniref:TetR/AcrR family transcriptional regulator n=1 Tax=Sphingomicrobium aestuariivivum TaxID=1582356 RepID=UPI001FD6850D|nr:TetR/AcrR family transcriptional regulator [Sphingomicrobium aestuariivivum]MCJ8191064.1 TetR/AcrR family transcriptional regulator [Sphingomicrobium aestuariivivum]
MVQSRSKTTRERVLAAAADLLMERGIADVTIKDIRDRSGVSNGSIFHHFGSKDGVVAEIFARERLAYLGRVAEAILDHDGDPCDAFGEGARAALEWQVANPQRFSRLVAAFNDSDWLRENGEIWRDLAHEIEVPVITWAVPHFEAGRLPLLPATFFQAMITGFTEKLTQTWTMQRLERDPTHFGDEVALMTAAGLKALREKQGQQR